MVLQQFMPLSPFRARYEERGTLRYQVFRPQSSFLRIRLCVFAPLRDTKKVWFIYLRIAVTKPYCPMANPSLCQTQLMVEFVTQHFRIRK
jgi:hypothetical protein